MDAGGYGQQVIAAPVAIVLAQLSFVEVEQSKIAQPQSWQFDKINHDIEECNV